MRKQISRLAWKTILLLELAASTACFSIHARDLHLCPSCGEELVQDESSAERPYEFCPYCGKRLAVVQEEKAASKKNAVLSLARDTPSILLACTMLSLLAGTVVFGERGKRR